MAYKFALQSEVTEANKWCLEVLHGVQKELRSYFTFDIRLIGSGEKKLVTQNGNEPFDLDYNLILQRDKQDLLNNPKRIKELFRQAFDVILEDKLDGYNNYDQHVSDSSSVITIKILYDNRLDFSFDVAIIVEANDGFFYLLKNDKTSNRYLWNQVKSSKNYFTRYQSLKENGQFEQFKENYLDLKNRHLRKNDGVKSFSIFLETLNLFCKESK